MKKSLIALAVLAASGASFAQSSVTVYGLIDTWVGSNKVEVNAGGASSSATETLLDSGGVNTSRWGLKGSEDLGGGLKANFQLEQGFDVSKGSATAGMAFDRQSWVGFSGGFGEVQLGQVWSPYDDTRSAINDTFSANISSSNSTWVGYQDRLRNAIKFQSANYSGFSGAVAYAMGEDKTDKVDASSITAFSLAYAGGPLAVGFAYQEQKQSGVNGVFSLFNGGIVNADVAKAVNNGAAPVATPGKTKYTLLTASYNFGVAKVLGGINNVEHEVTGVAGKLEADEFNLGVEVPVSGAVNLAAGYAESKLKGNGTDIGKSKGYSVAGTYTLSKRTFLYAAITETKFDASRVNFNAKSNLYAVGVQHRF